jgi:exosortase
MRSSRLIAVLTAALLLICYAPALQGMFFQWMTDEDMGHGFAVPFVVLWIVWRERERWQRIPLAPSGWGFALLGLGGAMHLAGALGVGLFASSLGFVISVAGAVVCLGGFGLLRSWAFPLLLSLFMLPKLAIVYNNVTLPLQLVASKLAAGMLTVTGIGVIREGNVLDVNGHRVMVAEACNGIRFLLPLGFASVLFAYLADPKPEHPRVWMRWAALAAALPIAILANGLRVAAAAWLPALDSGTPHLLAGWIIFVLCLGSLLPLYKLCNMLTGRKHA